MTSALRSCKVRAHAALRARARSRQHGFRSRGRSYQRPSNFARPGPFLRNEARPASRSSEAHIGAWISAIASSAATTPSLTAMCTNCFVAACATVSPESPPIEVLPACERRRYGRRDHLREADGTQSPACLDAPVAGSCRQGPPPRKWTPRWASCSRGGRPSRTNRGCTLASPASGALVVPG